ncbi:MAG: hypothetical protein M0C28_31980 [Candidatus Moduliflexus flocculans]|nr:hypothetical protein [Candidatus Moduliflexus flocculans]
MILKPVDNSASRGVFRIQDPASLERLFPLSLDQVRKPSVAIPLIIESFPDGPQLSTESFIVDGRIHTVGLSLRNYELIDRFAPHVIENGGDLPPETVASDRRRRLIASIDRGNGKSG